MFIPLHVKSDYSLGYGTSGVEELVAGAAALGYGALALTDLENLYAQVRFHHCCRAHGIRPLSGIELRPGFGGERCGGTRGRLLLLAADQAGYAGLCRLVSRRRGGGGGDPLPAVLQHPEGLYALSDDPAVVERLKDGGFPPERLGMLLPRPAEPGEERERLQGARRLGVPLVADLDIFLLEPEDQRLHLLQRAVSLGTRVDMLPPEEAEAVPRFLRPPAEAAALFADLPGALQETARIAAACTFELRPLAPAEEEREAEEELRRLCREGIAAKGEWSAAHDLRLAAELQIFRRLGFSRLMLQVGEILAHCRSEGIPVVVRGSAVSSLALHLLGGSSVDPLRHGLLFERFLHEGKSAWPDVDIDLPWHRRDEVIDWVFRRFGSDRVAMVSAHHTFRLRSALREGLKGLGIGAVLAERLARLVPEEDAEAADFLDIAAAEPPLPAGAVPAEALALVRRLVGRPRHLAAHPGGVVICDRPLEDILPLERAPKGVPVTQYDGASLERLGLAKIDLLGNRCLSEIEEALTLAGWPRPLRLDSVPSDDAATLALLDRGETIGCFQLESPAMRSLLARLPIRAEADIIAALALVRPGAAA
ncbi:MAG TPA: PHP domain-containing protein, partial [Verrucomicrobiae bacterium]|nr:PHP domain-containing protein [Verrucomicrobiae bacterium]